MSCSQFENVSMGKPIEIFALSAKCKADTHPNKVDLGVGAYRTNEAKPWILPAIRTAEIQIANDQTLNHEYLPVAGMPDLRENSLKLLFGADSPILSRAVGFQSLGGTGAIRIGLDFMSKHLKSRSALVADPTWGNHHGILAAAGFTDVKKYNYWNAKERSVDMPAIMASLNAASEGTVVILHAVAHNPTGCDPSHEQWMQIAEVMRAKKLFPFFDLAYQGIATGDFEKDAWVPRYFAENGFEMMTAQSFSKNFGLYNERVGCLSIVTHKPDVHPQIQSQMEMIIRTTYSNPSNHGARIVATVLNNPALRLEWLENVRTIAERILLMRQQLFDRLKANGTPGSWTHVISQNGMFSYTGLSEKQSVALVEKHHVYLMKSGRINMCGLTTHNIDYVAKAIHDVVTTIQG